MRNRFTVLVTVLAMLGSLVAISQSWADSHETLRPVTHEDVWLMKRLGTPVPSPDGKWAVVSVAEPSYEEDGDQSDLWVVATDGKSEPRRLTATKSPESGTAWSPDSSRIAFSAKRGDKEDPAQIFVLDMTGPGEAVQITDWATGAKNPKWSPDGSMIAFEARVYPGATDNEANAAEKKRRKDLDYNASAYEIFPIRQWDRWRDDLQTHLLVQEARGGAEARNLLAGSELVSGPGFAGVPALSGDGLQAEWAPDGNSLVFSATVNLHQSAFSKTHYHLYQVPLDGGEPTPLTGGSDYSCHSAKFSPDGTSLVCKYSPVTEFVYELTELARLRWPDGGDPQVLTGEFDRPVGDFDFISGGRSMALSVAEHGRVRLYSMSMKGGKATPLNPKSRGVYAGLKTAGKELVARWESSARPAEIVVINRRNGQHRALTSFNAERAAQLDRPAFREFWFESSKGRNIHSWLALPPNFDESRKYPLVLMIHGGPHSSSRDADHVRWSPHLLAAPGYVVLLTDYTGSVGYGEKFAQNIQGDPLKTPGEELVEAVDAALERFEFIDGTRVAATGASYGGHLVNWLQATTTRFDALVGHAGLVSLEGQWSTSDVIYHRERNNGGEPWGDSTIWREQSPSTYADQWATPMMLTIGEKDYRVPVNQTIAAWSYMMRNQVPGKLLVFHDANHWVMKGPEARHYWSEVHDWLGRYLDEPKPAVAANE